MVASAMLSSLLDRSRTQMPHKRDRSLFASPFATTASPLATRGSRAKERQRPSADYDASEYTNNNGESSQDDEEGPKDVDEAGREDDVEHEADIEQEDEDGVDENTPLLPIFSAAHLDALPVYNLTHTIRLLVVARCETTLSWDQLRSPQVSQFLLRPIQQEILSAHLSSATEYALMANCHQFHKEVDLYPGNTGTSRTRAMVCELIAIKLLKEYTARELIDALSYDFDPFQGQLPAAQGPVFTLSNAPKPKWEPSRPKWTPRAARISCLEIAIRAQAKRFLAHPVVVQQLEAIWAGSIVFHSAADSMHRSRQTVPNQNRGYMSSHHNTKHSNSNRLDSSPSELQLAKQREHSYGVELTIRRAVTLYNPREASLLKLSRLRVPRYRNLLSTCSFAVLLGLFLAVLIRQSLEITILEVLFWFWTAGYMLDEIVGFNEQGFSLYIASFWNTFDLGILLILIVHLCLRIYSVIMPDERRHHVANLAYDILAADAVLLFPRLFSVLDHYRYFSQLLIAFRMMASDLMAIFVLIIISCSGFFVALTLGFGNDRIDTPESVAYVLLQILMGFTPAAWDRWSGYNALGKTILTLFLFICHFLVVTILITVLTNSFMAIVQNANEEHQFVFAVNTISMVKSDALFSYVAPTNVISWILTPLRYIIPFRQYVKVNRTVIKITHFPILFLIFLYETTILGSSVVDSIDLVESRGRSTNGPNQRSQRLLREPSIATHGQDRVLDEVFRVKPSENTITINHRSKERRNTSNVVSKWMSSMDDGPASPPQEQDRSIVDRLEKRRLHRRKSQLSMLGRHLSHARSVASDPEEFRVNNDTLSPTALVVKSNDVTPSNVDIPIQQTGLGGDDELLATKTTDEDATSPNLRSSTVEFDKPFAPTQPVKPVDYFSRYSSWRKPNPDKLNSLGPLAHPRYDMQSIGSSMSDQASPSRTVPKHRPNPHLRNVSAATAVYNPAEDLIREDKLVAGYGRISAHGTASAGSRSTHPNSGALTPASKPTSTAAGRRTPKNPVPGPPRARPIMPLMDNGGFQSHPNMAELAMLQLHSRGAESRPSAFAMDLGSDIGDNKAIGGGYVGTLPASLGTQMAYATEALQDNVGERDRDIFGRLMLARMNNLEAGFREVVHEMRGHLRREEKRSRSYDPRGRAPRSHGKAKEEVGDKEDRLGSEEKELLKPRNPHPDIQIQRAELESTDEWIDEDLEIKGGAV